MHYTVMLTCLEWCYPHCPKWRELLLAPAGALADEAPVSKEVAKGLSAIWSLSSLNLLSCVAFLLEMAEKSAFFFKKQVEFNEKARNKFLTDEAKPLIEKMITELAAVESYSLENIESLFKKIVEEEGMKLGKLAQPVRVALTGTTVSPGIYDVILLLGKEETLKRLKNVV